MKCEICKKELRRLTNSHLQSHALNSKGEYETLIKRIPKSVLNMRCCNKRTMLINMIAKRKVLR